MAINEAELRDCPKPIPYESTKKILDQMAKNICKINIDGKRGTGFFTKIPIDDKLIPVFMTNYHVIDKEYLDSKNEIKVDLYNDESKIINIKNKVIYYNKEYDVVVVEIDEKKDGKYDYLALDDNILKKNKIDDYIGKSIYIIQYPSYQENQQLSVSYGIIKNRFDDEEEYNFRHYCSTEYGSSGSPILNIYNNKIIGIHKQRHEKNNYNIGSFLYYSIKEYINKYKEKINNKKKENDNKYDNECLKEFNKQYNLNIKDINITKLDLSYKKIGNDGLKYLCEKMNFKELKDLNLYDNNISDIKVLENVKFEKLDLSGNKEISDYKISFIIKILKSKNNNLLIY